MAEVNLLIKTKTADERTSTTTITNVNPQATDAQLYELGMKYYSFMTTSEPTITKQTNDILSGGE